MKILNFFLVFLLIFSILTTFLDFLRPELNITNTVENLLGFILGFILYVLIPIKYLLVEGLNFCIDIINEVIPDLTKIEQQNFDFIVWIQGFFELLLLILVFFRQSIIDMIIFIPAVVIDIFIVTPLNSIVNYLNLPIINDIWNGVYISDEFTTFKEIKELSSTVSITINIPGLYKIFRFTEDYNVYFGSTTAFGSGGCRGCPGAIFEQFIFKVDLVNVYFVFDGNIWKLIFKIFYELEQVISFEQFLGIDTLRSDAGIYWFNRVIEAYGI